MDFKKERLYRLYEVQSKLRVSRNTIYNWIHMGIKKKKIVGNSVIMQSVRLDAKKVGGEFRIPGSEINYFLAETGREY